MRFFKVLGVLSVCLSAFNAYAQSAPARDYPNHPIKMVIPYAAGGPMDFIGRTLSPRLALSLGQPVAVSYTHLTLPTIYSV